MKQMIPDALKFPSARNHSDVLYEKLRDAITSSEFPPGYVFPNEVEFCSLLNVGRSTLREAYKMLEADGYITRTKRGTKVNGREEIERRTSFDEKLRSAEYADLLEFRIMLESETARCAALRRSGEDLKSIYQCLEKMEDARDVEEEARHDTDFHLAIAKASHNALLENSMCAILSLFKSLVVSSLSEDCGKRGSGTRIMKALSYHRRIADAVKAGDGKSAGKIMREHILDVYKVSKEDE